MMVRPLGLVCLFIAILASPANANETLIDFRDPDAVGARRPLLIAHRGGVVTASIPECSLGAIRAAAAAGYDMAELDVRQSKDGEPVVFHDEHLKEDCGVEGRVQDFTADQLGAIRYTGTDQTIADLDDALGLCRSINLGVMLDVKKADAACLQVVADLVREHGLEHSTITISGDPTVRRILEPVSMLRITDLDRDTVGDLPPDAYRRRFWFGLPQDLPSELVPVLQSKGALVIPAINTFRYGDNPDPECPRKDIERLNAAGVDGFQIDSVYQQYFAE